MIDYTGEKKEKKKKGKKGKSKNAYCLQVQWIKNNHVKNTLKII